MSNVDNRLKELGLELPNLTEPVGPYKGVNIIDGNLYTSGQLPYVGNILKFSGKVGLDVTVEEAYEAAKICTLWILAEMKATIGDLDYIDKIVKVNGYVNSQNDFFEQSKVINGASDLLISVFGDKGKHARIAIGVSSLPENAVVEVELIASIKDDI